MPLKIHRFEVYLNDLEDPEAEPVGHEVRVLHIDQLMGEVAFTKTGLEMTNGMNLTNAWVYAACQRLGLYPKDRPWALFRQSDCAGLQSMDKAGQEADVDPTTAPPLGVPASG